ncbi:MAG: hypothetical protein Q9157_005629 [Trypethelium eluteriae]
MPHTNRHKKRPQWNKTRTIATCDGWSTVTSTRSKASSDILQEHAPSSRSIDSDATREVLAEEFRRTKEKWGAAESATRLRQDLKSRDGLHIDKAICFGLGTMCLEKELRSRSIMQLAAFADMASSRKSESSRH